MSFVESISYHVGHGAMHYFIVYNDNYQVEKKILIDAGSNQLDVEEINHNAAIVYNDILASDPKQCIFCLTHLHTDHYSFFTKILESLGEKITVVEKFYIGGCTQHELDELTEYQDFDNAADTNGLVALRNIINILRTYNRAEILGRTDPLTEALWTSGDNSVQLYVLFNCFFNGTPGEYSNDNSANFLVRNNRSKKAIWVMGDATGSTFSYLITNNLYSGQLCSRIDNLISNYEVVITVPHHGSIKTLLYDNFVIPDNWNADNWVLFCKAVGLSDYSLSLSACFNDQYGNPDGAAIHTYIAGAKPITNNTDWMVYKTDSSEPDEWFGKSIQSAEGYRLLAEGWYRQNLPARLVATIDLDPDQDLANWINIYWKL